MIISGASPLVFLRLKFKYNYGIPRRASIILEAVPNNATKNSLFSNKNVNTVSTPIMIANAIKYVVNFFQYQKDSTKISASFVLVALNGVRFNTSFSSMIFSIF